MLLSLFLLGCVGPIKSEIDNTEEGVFFEDNDGDGWIDALDPGCESSITNEEPSSNPAPAICSNGEDDDGDGDIDGNDAQCENPYDNDESQ